MLKKFSKFALVGACNGLSYGLLLFVLTDLFKVWYMASAMISIALVTLGTFTVHNIWTWGNKKRGTREIVTVYRFLKYCIIGGCSALFGLSLLYILTEYIKTWYIISYLIGSVIVITGTFLAHYYWTWGKTEGTELDFVIKLLTRTRLLFILNRVGIKTQ